MNPEFDNLLSHRYPEIFRDRHGDPASESRPPSFDIHNHFNRAVNPQAHRLIELAQQHAKRTCQLRRYLERKR